MNDPIPIPGVPTPVFTTTPPASQGIGPVTFALSADIAHAPKYTLSVKRNGTAVTPPATVTSGSMQIPFNEIDIPTTGTGNLVIDAGFLTNLGAGTYKLTITANNNLGLPGTGTTSVLFTVTGP